MGTAGKELGLSEKGGLMALAGPVLCEEAAPAHVLVDTNLQER